MRIKFLFLIFIISFSFAISLSAQTSDQFLLTVGGEVEHPLRLTMNDLAKMKRDTAGLTGHDNIRRIFSGVPVTDILSMAGVTMGKDLHGKNFAKYLLVKCADGYEVLFSLGELDASIINKTVILADQSDGKPLPEDRGPFRLVIPGEKRPARSCYQVVSFTVGIAK
jgi:DMSO/TMAO reductase YedYZ molybdopterin-dependent catalytic subunit